MKTQIALASKIVGTGVILALCSPFAMAGNESGHGGGAFICPDPSKSELLDLFEAQIGGIIADDPLTILRSNEAVEVQIQDIFSKLKTSSPLYQAVLDFYGRVRAAKKIPIPMGNLTWPSDASNAVTKRGCIPTGIGLFNDKRNSMLIDEISLNSLPYTDQAAFWVHETVYKFLRETQGDSSSVRARQLVAHLFSNESHEQLHQAAQAIAGWDIDANDVVLSYKSRSGDEKGAIIVSGGGYIGRKVPIVARLVPDPSNSQECRYPMEVYFGMGDDPGTEDSSPWNIAQGKTLPSVYTISLRGGIAMVSIADYAENPKNIGYPFYGQRGKNGPIRCLLNLSLIAPSGQELRLGRISSDAWQIGKAEHHRHYFILNVENMNAPAR